MRGENLVADINAAVRENYGDNVTAFQIHRAQQKPDNHGVPGL